MEKMIEKIQQWEKEKCLLRIKVVLKKKGAHILVGRIMSFNLDDMSLLIYLDDAKKVEHYTLNEIDDIVPANH